jgi:hypothetical protein
MLNPRRLVAVAALVLLSIAGCRKNKAVSVGTCVSSATQCGVAIAVEGEPARELKCTPPDTKLPMACDCVQGGVATKHTQVESKLPSDAEEAEKLARAKCAW